MAESQHFSKKLPFRLTARCSSGDEPPIAFSSPWLQTSVLAAWLNDPQRPRPVLLDVREPAEFDLGHLADARRVEPGSDPAARSRAGAR